MAKNIKKPKTIRNRLRNKYLFVKVPFCPYSNIDNTGLLLTILNKINCIHHLQLLPRLVTQNESRLNLIYPVRQPKPAAQPPITAQACGAVYHLAVFNQNDRRCYRHLPLR